MNPFAPIAYLRSRHLDTPTHKNSLAVSEKTSSRQLVNRGIALITEYLRTLQGC
jgi:hypothetical protein